MQAALSNAPLQRPTPVSTTQHQSRDELLMLATNRFCDVDTHTRLTVDQFKEAFYLLVGEASNVTKQMMARTLAHCDSTPRPIALYLSLEPLIISEPLLQYSTVLGQLDLLQIIQMKGADHAAIVAKRPDIGPSVVKSLKEFDDASVQDQLAANYALIEDAPQRSAAALFDKIDTIPLKKVRAELNSKTEIATTSEALPKTEERTKTETQLLQAAARGNRLEQPVSQHLITPQINEFDFGDTFEKLAKSRSHQAMVVLMTKRFSLSQETGHRILLDETGSTLSVLLRAADVEDAQANRILLLVNPTIGLSVHNAMQAIRFYAKLKTESCLDAVSQWPKAEAINAGSQHQTYLEDRAPQRALRQSNEYETHSNVGIRDNRLAG